MSRYLARKTLLYLITLWVAITVDWAIPRLMPGDPINGLIARLQTDDTAARELHGYFTESFGLDQPLWRQYLDFWRGLLQGDLGPSIAYVGSSVSELILNARPVHARAAHSGDRAELHRGQPRRRVGGAAQGPRQHRSARVVHPHGDAVHVARLDARLRVRVPAADLPRVGRVRLLPPARVELGVRAQLRQPLGAAVPLAVPRRVRRLGDRDAQPDHLRARGRLRELPAVARRPVSGSSGATPTATRSCRRCPASRSRSARSWAARS